MSMQILKHKYREQLRAIKLISFSGNGMVRSSAQRSNTRATACGLSFEQTRQSFPWLLYNHVVKQETTKSHTHQEVPNEPYGCEMRKQDMVSIVL